MIKGLSLLPTVVLSNSWPRLALVVKKLTRNGIGLVLMALVQLRHRLDQIKRRKHSKYLLLAMLARDER